MDMFGKLSMNSIPWSQPIPLTAFGAIILIIISVLATITFTR